MKAVRNPTGLIRLLLLESASMQYNPPPKCNVVRSKTYPKQKKSTAGKAIFHLRQKRHSDARYQSTKKEASDTINRKQHIRLKVEDKYVALTKQRLNSPFKFNSYPNSKHDPFTSQETVPTAYPIHHEAVPTLKTPMSCEIESTQMPRGNPYNEQKSR